MTLGLLLMIMGVVSSTFAQQPLQNDSNETLTTETSTSSTAATVPVTTISDAATTSFISQTNCSSCISSFRSIYMNTNVSNSSSSMTHWPDANDCPPDSHLLNSSCVSLVRDNCTDILNLLFSVNSNTSFGLTCTSSGLRVFKWTDCQPGSVTARMINESNTFFCRMRNFNCSTDSNGITSINRIDVLKPQTKHNGCTMPTTSPPTIPLLPNPVGPSAITAIVVLVCLFIVAVLAGFFFWPKCHMSKNPPATPKKQVPPTEAFNVAYSGSSDNLASTVSIAVNPSQTAGRGPAAA